jgi:hypothetical protein
MGQGQRVVMALMRSLTPAMDADTALVTMAPKVSADLTTSEAKNRQVGRRRNHASKQRIGQ